MWDARRLDDAEMVEYFRRRAIVAAVVAGVVAFVGIFVLHADARYLFDGLTSRALPLVIISALCGIGSLVLLLRDAHRGARAPRDRRGRDASWSAGASRSGRTCCPTSAEGLAGRRARRHARRRCSSCSCSPR